jgi:pimeloyl-ACP methyl ester carboxylesterase
MVTVALLLWLVGAWKAGLFIRDRTAFASRPPASAANPAKQFVDVGAWRVAYLDVGNGPPLVLLHGCPFQSYEYKRVLPRLALHHRVIVPDLLGLGDTEVRLDDDYRLPNQVKMVIGLLDRLGIERASVVGHDHGAAITQLMMNQHPERLRAVVLTNAEAYDLWPSEPERLDVELVVNPFTTAYMRLLLGTRTAQRFIYRIAVKQPESLSDDVLDDFTRPNMATPARWLRLRRFLRWQLDPDHNLETLRAVEGLRRFRQPTLILWGRADTNFGPAIAERLKSDIPGVVGLKWMERSAHLPMLEEPDAYASAVEEFLAKLEDGPPR